MAKIFPVATSGLFAIGPIEVQLDPFGDNAASPAPGSQGTGLADRFEHRREDQTKMFVYEVYQDDAAFDLHPHGFSIRRRLPE